jgi:hypothetical protein
MPPVAALCAVCGEAAVRREHPLYPQVVLWLCPLGHGVVTREGGRAWP